MSVSTILSKINDSLFSTRAAGMYLLLFAIAIGVATFVENDFGTSSAQDIIFKARWFELLLVLFGGTIISNIFRFRMVQQKKWASLCFHSAIIVIIIGAGVTRYFGYEGMMHIREGNSSDYFLSTESFLKFKVTQNGKSYSFDEPVYFSTLGSNTFKGSYQIGNYIYDISLNEFVPNPVEKLEPMDGGAAIMKVVIAGKGGREEIYVEQGDRVNINGVNFNFNDNILPNAFNVIVRNDSLFFSTDVAVVQTVMATQTTDTIPGDGYHPLRLRSMYNVRGAGFVIGDFRSAGSVSIVAGDRKMKNESIGGLMMTVSRNGQAKDQLVMGRKGDEGQPKVVDFGDSQLAISYGAKQVKLPFSLKLHDFIMERYPGTQNPSSYASEVSLVDPANGVNKPFRIFMNNILDYGGYRFFQSSFDQDEAGTYLSVNHDFWGTWISYIGYILLTIGLIMTFFSKNSRFTSLMQKLQQLQSQQSPTMVILIFLSIMTVPAFAASNPNTVSVSKDHAALFGKLLVQDHKGRFKPVNTLTNEVLRKIAKKESIEGLNADQIFLSMMIDPASWENFPMIDIGMHPEVQKILGTTEKRITYRQFFANDGQYVLRDHVRNAQSTNPKDQGTFEKAILKLDEKVNIASMIFSGRLLKIFPVPRDAANTWISPADFKEIQAPAPELNASFVDFSDYMLSLEKGIATGDFTVSDGLIQRMKDKQRLAGGDVLPSTTKIQAELLLNKWNIFGNLRNVYGLVCIVLLFFFFYSIFNRAQNIPMYTRWVWYILLGIFAFHTLGLGLRWYVSGRAPWSNGYESMIYISWTTMLAGLIFSRKSLGGMAATTVLAATILLVAGMSWLDPEITPLVPVLKSYWLTIHVSLEAGSYGFLMLGAVIGMLNLILMIFAKSSNKERIYRTMKELTIISEITLLGGLIMVSVGTYLGGVWANESWGRYWGWDAKETWALVTILVYAFILHMRFIPGLQSIYAFNFASLFGFATVIMTYFGVNYYLSGLHSYAAGDPVPVPPAVYYTALVLAMISILAYARWRKVS